MTNEQSLRGRHSSTSMDVNMHVLRISRSLGQKDDAVSLKGHGNNHTTIFHVLQHGVAFIARYLTKS